jgi:hypothetical protein
MSEKFYGHPRYYELLDEIKHIHSTKNHDYAGQADPLANFRECERSGVDAFTGCIVRLTDKYMRVANFVKNGTFKVKGESVKDTLQDLANYALIAIILMEEQENVPQKEPSPQLTNWNAENTISLEKLEEELDATEEKKKDRTLVDKLLRMGIRKDERVQSQETEVEQG